MSEAAVSGGAAEPVRLALVSGSLRAGSLNTAVLRTAGELARRASPEVQLSTVDIARLPLFNADVPETAAPEIARVVLTLRRSHGLLISTPEYNGNPPGALLNLLDWISRSPSTGPLLGLPTVTASASPGARGAIRAQQRLREALQRCGARLVADPVALGRATEQLGRDGLYAGPEAVRQLAAVVTALLAPGSDQRVRPAAAPAPGQR
jgi:chromate reductase, NAD(P)H dehydrogenase (quinone)